MLLNAESLANKMDEFRARVAEINPDIIGVTETWAKEVQSDQWYVLNGYHCIRCDNEEEMKGGVMIYFKENLKVSVCDELNRSKCRDSLWVWVTIGEEKFIAGCVYRKGTSPQGNNMLLENGIRKAREMTDKVMIFGDFNFPEIDWANHIVRAEGRPRQEEARGFMDTIDDVFLTQHVMKNTRVRGQDNHSCLDLILTESANSVEYCSPLGSSDHCILTWNYVVSVGFEMRSLRKKCYYRGDYTKMKEMPREIRWGEEIAGSTISEKFNQFREIMLGAEEECIPYGDGRNRPPPQKKNLGSMEKLKGHSEENSLLT